MLRSRSSIRSQVETMESRTMLSTLASTSFARCQNSPNVEIGTLLAPHDVVTQQDSIRIENRTSHALEVTAVLQSSPTRRITETVPRDRIHLFDFRSNNPSFISINVRRSDGGQIPTPLTNYPLNRPLEGYRGRLYSITVIGQTFSVSI